MIILDLPIYLFLLLALCLFVGGVVLGIGLTSWYVQKELQKLSKSRPKRKIFR